MDQALHIVVPHAGTWIEIEKLFEGKHHIGVVPQAGTWIEIWHILFSAAECRSFPTGIIPSQHTHNHTKRSLNIR